MPDPKLEALAKEKADQDAYLFLRRFASHACEQDVADLAALLQRVAGEARVEKIPGAYCARCGLTGPEYTIAHITSCYHVAMSNGLVKAEAQLANAQKEVGRLKDLFVTTCVSRDAWIKAADKAEAAVEQAREEGYNKAHAKWIVEFGRAQAELNELREAIAGKAYDPPGRENRNWVEIAQRMRAEELRIRPMESKP